jgi:C4-type Zn-finger protein
VLIDENYPSRECGYKGREVAEFLRKDPAAVTGYLKDEKSLHDKLERIFSLLGENSQDLNN